MLLTILIVAFAVLITARACWRLHQAHEDNRELYRGRRR